MGARNRGRTNGGSRAAVAAVRALAIAGYRAAVTVSGGPTLAAASRFVSRRVRVPSGDLDPTAYTAALSAELKSGGYLAAFAASEIAALALDPRSAVSKTNSSGRSKRTRSV